MTRNGWPFSRSITSFRMPAVPLGLVCSQICISICPSLLTHWTADSRSAAEGSDEATITSFTPFLCSNSRVCRITGLLNTGTVQIWTCRLIKGASLLSGFHSASIITAFMRTPKVEDIQISCHCPNRQASYSLILLQTHPNMPFIQDGSWNTPAKTSENIPISPLTADSVPVGCGRI